jgi:hypothetical protein
MTAGNEVQMPTASAQAKMIYKNGGAQENQVRQTEICFMRTSKCSGFVSAQKT